MAIRLEAIAISLEAIAVRLRSSIRLEVHQGRATKEQCVDILVAGERVFDIPRKFEAVENFSNEQEEELWMFSICKILSMSVSYKYICSNNYFNHFRT